jgi:hypothetical protein
LPKIENPSPKEHTMHNQNRLVFSLASTVLLLALSACQLGAPATTPQSTAAILAATAAMPTPTKPSAPTTVPDPTDTPVPANATPEPTQSAWNGDWSGKTSQATGFEFQVKDNQVVYFNFSYQNQVGSCIYSGGFGDQVSSPLVGNRFTIDWKDRDGNRALITGTLTDTGSASGSIEYTDNVKEICDKSMHISWNALSATVMAAGTPVAPPEILAEAAGINGKWAGQNQDGNQVSFTVEDNQLTYVLFNYWAHGGCSLSGALSQAPTDGAVTDQSFSTQFEDKDGRLFTFAGSFSSDNEAAGTINIKGKAGTFCGDFKSEETWTAQKARPDAGPTAPAAQPTAPAAPPTETPAASDPLAVVQGFFDAINTANLEAALAFADDPVWNIGSSARGIGNDKLSNYLTTQIAAGTTYTPSDMKAVGDSMVKFTITSSDGTVYTNCLVMLDNGKISLLKLE